MNDVWVPTNFISLFFAINSVQSVVRGGNMTKTQDFICI